ncbi:MAG: hypothetical protein FJ098_08445, partial [Deltaproteobacteria bacterium]|nr:hypothetical protein [Deltaproteobacteria bacterium]
ARPGDSAGDMTPGEDSTVPPDGGLPTDTVEDLPRSEDLLPPEDTLPPQDTAPQPCQEDGDCPSGVCDPLPGLCVECLFDHQCSAGHHCTSGACQPFTPCLAEEDCPAGLHCALAAGECVACTDDVHCMELSGTPHCDLVAFACAVCTGDAHCPEAHECLAGACVPFEPCGSSKDCADGICWPEKGKCVDCLEDADCEAGFLCHVQVCQPVCDSDKDCKDQDGVCDKDQGLCADCVAHEDCPPVYHCKAGACVLDLCAAGVLSCQEGAIVGCNATGDAFEVQTVCAEGQVCKEEGVAAACLDPVCPAGEAWCDEEGHARLCAPDGLSFLLDQDCIAEGLVCEAGACAAVICEPGTEGCDAVGLGREECSPLGTAWLPVPCPEASFCQPNPDLGTSLCVPQVCSPGAATCLGSLAATCNANGSGVLEGGEDCEGQGLACMAGACIPCLDHEDCDGADNDCDGAIDEQASDCPAPGLCALGACFQPIPGGNCWIKEFGGHVYMACYVNGTNAAEAAALCAGWNGAHLAVLDSADEEAFLLGNISGAAFIGYSDAAVEGQWTWAVGAPTFLHWCPGQPDNWSGGEDCCMMKSSVGGQSNCWNDVSCATDGNRFVCEAEGV